MIDLVAAVYWGIAAGLLWGWQAGLMITFGFGSLAFIHMRLDILYDAIMLDKRGDSDDGGTSG